MGKMILMLVGTVVTLLGVTMIFDARTLTKKLFSFGDQNEGSSGMKIVGFIFAVIGALVIFFNLK